MRVIRRIVDWLLRPVDRLDDVLHAAGPDRWVGDGGEDRMCGARSATGVHTCGVWDLHVGSVIVAHSGEHRCGECGAPFTAERGAG